MRTRGAVLVFLGILRSIAHREKRNVGLKRRREATPDARGNSRYRLSGNLNYFSLLMRALTKWL